MGARAASGGVSGAFDVAAESAEWSKWYADYLTQASSQSSRTLDLYREVLECVSQGDLAPTALQDLLPRFVERRGVDYASRLSRLGTEFFTGLIEVSGAYSREMAGLVNPDQPARPAPPPPVYNAADPVRWFQDLVDYANALNARALEAYRSHLERVAAGETPPGDVQQATSAYLEDRLPDHVRRLGRLYFDLLNGLNDLRAGYEEEYLAGVLATARRAGEASSFVLKLTGPLGDTASASLSIANTRDVRALVRCSVTDLRRADGGGPAFAPAATFVPDGVELAPGEEGSVRISIRLDQADYDLDAPYVGTVYVTGHGSPRFEIPLRITATRPEPAAEGIDQPAKPKRRP